MEQNMPHRALDRILRLVPDSLRWMIPWSQRHHLHHRSPDEREIDHEHWTHDELRYIEDRHSRQRRRHEERANRIRRRDQHFR